MGNLVILIANYPYTLVGSLEETPLAVKPLEKRLYMSIISHMKIAVQN